ncbi:hypothetical protein PYW08_012937 [Mythimna loreyi]|uniref:Uncharacterized protein n=1 Tax=Mythimna loreyi TaxID=667449 RepID=A0ACC2PYK1_9NEOP|nr:hypothetical protein PYW08_012937 [Mythimna loreyi]
MGKQQSKEETFVIQNAAGSNEAKTDEIRFHMSITNIFLAIILLVILLRLIYFVYRLYRRCHVRWITNEINRTTMMRRSFLRRRLLSGVNENTAKTYSEDMV